MKEANTIAFICHPYHRGGVTSWMVSASQEAVRMGLNVYFVTVQPEREFISGGNRPSMVELLTFKEDNFHLVSPKVGYEFELGTDDYRCLIYRNAVLKNVPLNTPLIVSDDSSVWKTAAWISNDYPMVGVLHSDDYHYYQLAENYENYVSTYVAVSSRIASKARLKSEKKISVIPCGIDLTQFREDKNENTDERLKLCWVGRVEELQKRVSDIPLIAEVLKNRGVKYQLLVAGTGPELEWLRDTIDKKGLTDNVVLLGWKSIEEVKELLKKSDILLQTSNFEGMSVAVMEALASGCSVVSSRVSGVEDYEFSDWNKNCLYLYEIGDIQNAVLQIEASSQQPFSERVSATKTFALKVFSIQECMKQYLEAINNNTTVSAGLKFNKSDISVIIKSRMIAFLRKVKYEIRHSN